jgi:O-antigen/teichoic acid export membrane protein
MNILITMIINTVNNNILTFVFGKLFTKTPEVVGNFFQAFKWNTMAYQVVGGMVEQVAQPVLVEVRNERELTVFRKMLRFTAFLAFPAMFGLSLVSEEFILVTIGSKWLACVPLLRVLCIRGAFMPFYSLYKNLIISQGRSDVNMWLNIVQIVLQMALILLTYRYGIMAVVIAYSLLNIMWLLMWQLYAKRMIGLPFLHALKDIVPFALISAAVMGITWLVTSFISNIYVLLPLRIIIAVVLYAAVMKLLRVKMMEECIHFITRKR